MHQHKEDEMAKRQKPNHELHPVPEGATAALNRQSAGDAALVAKLDEFERAVIEANSRNATPANGHYVARLRAEIIAMAGCREGVLMRVKIWGLSGWRWGSASVSRVD
jgi:hypothetical protein